MSDCVSGCPGMGPLIEPERWSDAEPIHHEQAERTARAPNQGSEPIEQAAETGGTQPQRNCDRNRKRRHSEDGTEAEQGDERQTSHPGLHGSDAQDDERRGTGHAVCHTDRERAPRRPACMQMIVR